MSSPELDALLVANLSDLEAVRRQLVEVERDVFRKVDACVRDWATEQGWNGVFDWLEDDLWLAPPAWRTAEGESANEFAWFVLGFGPDDAGKGGPGEDYLYLTRLCQAGFGQLGFVVGQNLLGEAAWKRHLKSHADLIEKSPFVHDRKGRLFLPVRVDQRELADAVREQSIADALMPVRAALDQLAESQPVLQPLLDAARTGSLLV